MVFPPDAVLSIWTRGITTGGDVRVGGRASVTGNSFQSNSQGGRVKHFLKNLLFIVAIKLPLPRKRNTSSERKKKHMREKKSFLNFRSPPISNLKTG
jgi:hypothetical protein